MLQTESQTRETVGSLLKRWCDALIRLQVDLPGEPALDGGILCPCCRMIHGRCHEAVYPLLAAAALTGEPRYLKAAERLFRWGGNTVMPDGSMRNDAKSDWRGTTVFAAIALHDALFFHGSLLSSDVRTEWEARLLRAGEWLFENLLPGHVQAYVNYYAANALAMALLGGYFHREPFKRLARELAAFCFSHLSEKGLICGEGHPIDRTTPKGCLPIDVGGYNAEETLPCLTRCAAVLKDDVLTALSEDCWRAELKWMLPDGAWDDSVGTRAFKWTYWGSRTSDGCQDALFSLGEKDSVFSEAAFRNLQQYIRCTDGGLLYGGPDLHKNGELPCVHHTFCHAKTLAGSLNGGLPSFERLKLPSETLLPVTRYAELDTLRVAFGGWIADVVAGDCLPFPGAHASGGAISLLWHRKTGPLIASGAVDPVFREPFNQQLPSDPGRARSLCPRIETLAGGARYAQHYDREALIDARVSTEAVTVTVAAALRDREGVRLAENGACRLLYRFAADALVIEGGVSEKIAPSVRYYLPLIGNGAAVSVKRGETAAAPAEIFSLYPGFAAWEYVIIPDENGRFSVEIAVP